MKKVIDYVNKKIGEYGNISIHLGELTDKQVKQLEKHFKVRKGFLGYYSFTMKTSKVSICKECGNEYDIKERNRIYGKDSLLAMTNFCSSYCYTKAQTKSISKHTL